MLAMTFPGYYLWLVLWSGQEVRKGVALERLFATESCRLPQERFEDLVWVSLAAKCRVPFIRSAGRVGMCFS